MDSEERAESWSGDGGRAPARLTGPAIAAIEIAHAPWLRTPHLALKPGLIAIIGARGSGKTALADMIAAACGAVPPGVNTRSFLYRARPFLKDVTVALTWTGGEIHTRALMSDGGFTERSPIRARYLSQQFVEELCASDGVTSGLLREIERLVFESHDLSTRDGAIDFQELMAARAGRHRDARARDEAALLTLATRLAAETQKRAQAPALKAQIAEKEALVARLTAERDALAGHDGADNVNRLTALTHAAERVRSFVRYFTLQEQQLKALQDEVTRFRTHDAPEALQALQRRFAGTGLKGDAWAPFQLDYTGDTERALAENIARAQRSAASWRGRAPAPLGPDIELIHPMVDLQKVPLAILEAEIARLGQRVSLDRQTSDAFTTLSRRIAAEGDMLARLRDRLEDAAGAGERLVQLEADRTAAAERVFASFADEHAVLADLYAPIAARVAEGRGAMRKLSFTVRRDVDLARWVAVGEALLDLRRPGAFSASGALARAADALKDAWESGGAETIAPAMTAFRAMHEDALLAHAPFTDVAGGEHRDWRRRFNAWLTATDHIAVRYTVAYDGVDIRHLSPGTRGIVLLLLYLGFDDTDDRPLIIDQPEENLDPKSVYDELVGLFTAAKHKRQVILVTHNANLVVNTDADQVIVAEIGSNTGAGLPPITYRTGALDDPDTRQSVCDILEGGERAFRERARRLHLT